MTRETKMRAIWAAAGIFAGLLIFTPVLMRIEAARAFLQAFWHLHKGGDTPIIIAGGSVDAQAYEQGWTPSPSNPKREYTAAFQNAGSEYVTFTGFNGSPVNLSSETRNWKIRIFTFPKKPGDPNPEGVLLCSDKDCAVGDAIKDPNVVYLKANGSRRWKYKGNRHQVLHLRDDDCDTTADSAPESACDGMSSMTVHTSKVNGQSYACPDGACRIVVGNTD